jgi:hypothetical protein
MASKTNVCLEESWRISGMSGKTLGGSMKAFGAKFGMFLVLVISIVGMTKAYAQATNSGDIRGTVTDTTGALVPDVTVTVLNVATGVSKDYVTDHDGVYDTNSIVAGSYKLTFTKPGFSKYVRGPITVEVGYTTVNAPLKVGAASDTVTVNTDVPLLNTEGGDQTTTLEAHDMEQLPNIGGSNGPDWENFMILLPGTSGSIAGSQGSNNPGQEVSSNGNLPYTNVLADGASTTLPASQNANPATFEDVQELQVSLSTFTAQYGVGGLVINQITKGGTDKFHGVLYEYYQAPWLNSLPASYTGQAQSKPALQYDNFGGTVSGPVKIPFLGLNKKAFFFFGYDQIKDNTVGSGTNTIPTTQVMAGDFTGTNSYTLYDPTTQVIHTDSNGNSYPVRQTFISEYGTNAIPAAMIDTVSANFQKYYPTPTNHIPYGQFNTVNTPNFEGVYANNFFAEYPEPRPWKRYFGRLDYDITKHNRITLSDTQGNELENGDSAVTACPIACQVGDVDNNNAQVSDVWNVSSKVVNEARFGFTDQLNFFTDSSSGIGAPAQLGWQYAKADVIPSVQFYRNYPYAWIGPATNAQYKEFTFDPSDVVTLIEGKHILHFGGEMAFYRDDTTNWGNLNAGTLGFNGSYTEDWTLNGSGVASPNGGSSGEEYADFLLGYATSWSASLVPEIGARLKKPQMFVQDDWKIKPNLTINLGLRYEISHGFNETHGNEASFDPTVVNPANNKLGAYWFGETKANGRDSLEANVFSTVMPRVGFSWLAMPNTTIRGGFGIYSYNFSIDTYGNLGGGLDGSNHPAGNASDNSNGIYPITKFDGPGTTYPLGGGTSGPLPYTSPGTDPARFNGQGVSYEPYHTPIPEAYQWNIGFDRQLGASSVVNLSYIGSHGKNLAFPTDINAVPVQDLSPSDQTGCGSGASTCLRPYSLYQGIGGSIYNAISNYNSLQVVFTRRLSHGFSMSANYVWSHLLDDQDSSGWGSRAGPQAYQYATTLTQNLTSKNYGNSNFDVRNAFKAYVVYDLPFGKGRQFLNHNIFLDELIGGFQVSGTGVVSTGNPFPVYTSGNNTYQGTGSQFPNRVTGVSTKAIGTKGITNWYNPAAFSDPGNGVFGDSERNPVYGPGFVDDNLSILKSFTLPWERAKFSIRMDMQNFLNHTSLGQPDGTLGGSSGAGTPYTQTSNGQGNNEITGSNISGRNIQLGGRLSF